VLRLEISVLRVPTANPFFFVSLLFACDIWRSWQDKNCPFPVRCPRDGGSLQSPHCSPPRPVPRCIAHQGDYKGKTKERTKESRPRIVLLFCGGREGGRGEKQRCSSPPALTSSVSTLSSYLSLRSQSSHSDTSLYASSSAGGGTPEAEPRNLFTPAPNEPRRRSIGDRGLHLVL
jgi:hypothetical protein